MYVKQGSGSWQLYFICRDYLGSITHLVSSNGSLTQELSYDAWGRLRNPINHETYSPGSEPELFLGRGYTGHEHLPWFGLINMNGRLYDPVVSRFLSPDNYVQAPDFSQSFNRYGYVWNNPLKYTDPDGEIIGFIIAGVIIGSYVGGMVAEKGEYNSGKWAWDRNTWTGVAIGGVAGGVSGALVGGMWAAGATVSIGANIGGNTIPLIAFSKAGFATANTVAGVIGIGGAGAIAGSSINWSMVNVSSQDVANVYIETDGVGHAPLGEVCNFAEF